ncbi:MAG: hypothetical protein IKK43_04540 [Clostridia bacterium]|nr:hypothetical protein [Clostridia bacterium]
MLTNKDRMLIGLLALLGILLIGVIFFFFGETLIEFVLMIGELALVALKYVLYWVIGGTIILAFIFVAYMSFSKSKTAKELFESLIMRNDRNDM